MSYKGPEIQTQNVQILFPGQWDRWLDGSQQTVRRPSHRRTHNAHSSKMELFSSWWILESSILQNSHHFSMLGFTLNFLLLSLQCAMTTTLRMNFYFIGFVAMMTLSNLRKISYSSTKCSIFTTRRYSQEFYVQLRKESVWFVILLYGQFYF